MVTIEYNYVTIDILEFHGPQCYTISFFVSQLYHQYWIGISWGKWSMVVWYGFFMVIEWDVTGQFMSLSLIIGSITGKWPTRSPLKLGKRMIKDDKPENVRVPKRVTSTLTVFSFWIKSFVWSCRASREKQVGMEIQALFHPILKMWGYSITGIPMGLVNLGWLWDD